MVNITNVNWHEIETEGMPEKSLRTVNGHIPRTFLIRGEYSITTASMIQQGSGCFDTDPSYCDNIIAWAVIDGF
jgi:hypothetical protein